MPAGSASSASSASSGSAMIRPVTSSQYCSGSPPQGRRLDEKENSTCPMTSCMAAPSTLSIIICQGRHSIRADAVDGRLKAGYPRET